MTTKTTSKVQDNTTESETLIIYSTILSAYRIQDYIIVQL